MRKHTTTITRARTRRPRRTRRGVAMLLVLVALSTATVLTVSYVGSRDNTHAIAGNVKSAVDAQWAAASGASYALAILQTEADWNNVDPTELLQKHFGPGVNVLVTVTDLDGAAADSDDRDLIVTTTATVDGVTASRTHNVTRQLSQDPMEGIDPELKEFAVYARTSLTMEGGSLVRSWAQSPAHSSGRPVKFGVGFTEIGDLSLHSSAQTSNAALYVGPTASSSLRAAVEDARFVDGDVLQYQIPLMTPVAPSAFSLLSLVWQSISLYYSGSSSSQTFSNSAKWGNLTVANNAVATFNDGATYSFNDVTVSGRGVIRIAGNVRIEVRGDLSIYDSGTIEFADNTCSLELYLKDDLYVQDAGLGISRSVARNTSRSVADMTNYRDPARVRIYLSGSNDEIVIRDNAIVFASFHAPNASFDARSGATLIGRVTANTIRIRDTASIHYDLEMDGGLGFSSTDGPLYTSDGEPIKALSDALASIDTATGLAGFIATASNALADYSPLPVNDDDGVTKRDPNKAVARIWPVDIFALETYEAYTPPVTPSKGDVDNPGDVVINPELTELGGIDEIDEMEL